MATCYQFYISRMVKKVFQWVPFTSLVIRNMLIICHSLYRYYLIILPILLESNIYQVTIIEPLFSWWEWIVTFIELQIYMDAISIVNESIPTFFDSMYHPGTKLACLSIFGCSRQRLATWTTSCKQTQTFAVINSSFFILIVTNFVWS